jgi:S1-C subfamily serine protease
MQEIGKARKDFGLKMDATGMALSVEVGSQAEVLGLKAGDRVKTVDGREVSGRLEVQSALRFHDGAASLACEVLRGKETLLLESKKS